MGIGIKLWVKQVRNFGLMEVEFDDVGFLWTTDCPRGTTLLESQ